MIRLAVLLVCLAAPIAADPAGDAWELLSNAASALTERNPASFLSYFDSKMPGFAQIQNDVYALVAESEPASSIDLVSNEGDAANRELTVDWTLDMVIAQAGPTVASTRRKQRVKIRLEKRKKNWVIVSFEPQSFFSPPATSK